jgi:hypothetical protein
MDSRIQELHSQLTLHPLYSKLDQIDNLKIFMEFHSFAVYDFMCLLKSLQRHITMKNEPWKPAPYPDEVIRFINEIVLCEESDLDPDGKPCSHFNLYIRAMNEIHANSSKILSFVRSIRHMDYRTDELRPGVKEFVDFNLNLAVTGEVEELAGAFLFGREKLVPDMFKSIVRVLEKQNLPCPSFMHYLKRHIEVDGDEHGPMAEKCLEAICDRNKLMYAKANKIAVHSLELRVKLWDACLEAINEA